MNFKTLFLAAALPLCAEAPFYGNPSESCPQPFRVYTMGDYLFWQASEENLEYAMKQRAASALLAQGSVCALDFSYKDGFRIGGGVVFPHYDWQIEIDWTRYYRNLRSAEEQLLGGFPSLIGLWMLPDTLGFISWQSANFTWDLRFDTLDFDLLRIGFANANFSLTPRVGLKRAWIKQDFHVRYEQAYASDTGLFPNSYYDVRAKNDFRGIGQRVGFDTKLWAPWGFNVTAAAATALLYGHMHTQQIDVSSSFASVNVVENNYRFKPMLEGRIALEWERCFLKEDSFRVLLSVGYEGQIWWGQNQQRTFVSSSLPPSSIKLNGALTLKGLVCHARFDF